MKEFRSCCRCEKKVFNCLVTAEVWVLNGKVFGNLGGMGLAGGVALIVGAVGAMGVLGGEGGALGVVVTFPL